MPFFAFAQYAGSLVLNIAVIFYLLRGPFKRFPLIFFFCLLQILLASGSNFALFYLHSNSLFLKWYWMGDFLAHLGITLIIVLLIREALAGRPYQTAAACGLLAFMICVAVVSLVLFHEPRTNHWLTQVTRNLSFGEEILNFVLWGVLMQNTEIDYQLMLVSAGIGVQVSGEVIGITLRLYAPVSTAWVPNLLTYCCEILCLCVWIWAFKAKGPQMAQQDTLPIRDH